MLFVLKLFILAPILLNVKLLSREWERKRVIGFERVRGREGKLRRRI